MQKISKISKVNRIGVMRPGRIDAVLPGAKRAGAKQVDLMPEEIKAMIPIIGETRARAIFKLMQQGVQGTLPELSAYDWLEKKHVNFAFQSPLLGGRAQHGGAVIDFLLYDLSPQGYIIFRIQGDYWHAGIGRAGSGTATVAKDDIQKARLRATKVGGVPIIDVVDLWESRILGDWPRVFIAAEAGLELGRM